MKRIFILSVCVFCIVKTYGQSVTCPKAGIFLPGTVPCNDGDYYLAFEDNFDGNSLDIEKWNPITGVPRDNNFEQQKAWHLPENIEVSNGTLKIISKKLSTPYTGTWVSDWGTNPPTTKTSTFDYTTAEIWTHKTFDYGKYEIRCRIPEGKGFWPAFWTFGGPGWNEIDIFELYGDETDRFTCNVHHDYDGDGSSENCGYAQNNVANFTDWHVFTCLFDPDKITWLIDGSPIRQFYRYSTLTGATIECGEEVAYGTYFQEISFPMESMHIIANTAIQSGNEAPDASTVFPGIFEIDYVRFYIKSEQAPCDGCIDHIVYKNTDQLPTITRTSNYIYGGDGVTVKNGQNVSFKSPSIELLSGFLVEPGSNFQAIPEVCNLLNYTDVPINYVGHNAINNYQVVKCINPIYTIEATGVIYYSFEVYNQLGQLVYNTNGTATSNHIVVWNASNVASGWYEVKSSLLNCSDSDIRTYNLLVTQGNCIMINPSDTIPDKESRNRKEAITVYPNPANEELNVFYSINNSSSVMVITDMNGKEMYNNQVNNDIGANRKKIDTSHFPNGTYILRIFTNEERFENKFIISR